MVSEPCGLHMSEDWVFSVGNCRAGKYWRGALCTSSQCRKFAKRGLQEVPLQDELTPQ